jgi:phage tail tape-measure protein
MSPRSAGRQDDGAAQAARRPTLTTPPTPQERGAKAGLAAGGLAGAAAGIALGAAAGPAGAAVSALALAALLGGLGERAGATMAKRRHDKQD